MIAPFETSEAVEMEDPPFKLTVKQHEAIQLIGSEALFVLLYGGSRSTKTFTIVRAIVLRALAVPNSRHAILRFRFSHVKASIFYDTFPKVMSLCFPDCPYKPNREDWFVRFPNGSEVWFGGLDDKERTEKILGREYATIALNEVSQISYSSFLLMITRLAQVCHYFRGGVRKRLRLKMLLDENPPNKGHWSYKCFVLKIEPLSKAPLENPESYCSLLMNPKDNIENLDPTYLANLQRLPKRQRDRFWLGIFTDDTENALWTPEMLEAARATEVPQLVRVVVAVDPSGATDDENTNNDEIGICVAGLGIDGVGYVLEDLTLLGGPATWGAVATAAYKRHGADRLVAEVNFGGGMVEFVCRAADPNISFKALRASRGKTIRAEPIAALMEQEKIKLVGRFDNLEDECCGFTTFGYIGEKSPNRADAFIWAMSELFPGMAMRDGPDPNAVITIPIMKRL